MPTVEGRRFTEGSVGLPRNSSSSHCIHKATELAAQTDIGGSKIDPGKVTTSESITDGIITHMRLNGATFPFDYNEHAAQN
jgi:hypothetical protein